MPTYLILGVLAALAAGFLELALGLASDLFPAFLILDGREFRGSPSPLFLFLFAFVEEAVKFILLWKFLRESVRGAAVTMPALLFGAGFGGTEILIARTLFPDMPIGPLVGIPLVHIATSLLYGYAITADSDRKNLPAAALVLGIVLHALYNVFLA